MAEQFIKGEQAGWFYDLGVWGGYFHTYPQFQVGTVDKPRKIHVFLPRDYEISQQSYPVIYMNDGNTAFLSGSTSPKTWNMGQILTRLYLSDQIRKVIVVAVCPLNRDYEYTHAPVWENDWGGLDDYATYLAHRVKGFMDTHYRTRRDADNTLIMGASHGGLAAFYTAVRHPYYFGKVAALSPSFWVGLDSAIAVSLSKLAPEFLASLDTSALMVVAEETLKDFHKRPKIYLDWGLIREGGFQNEFIEERATARGREMRGLLVKNYGYRENIDLFVVEDPDGKHDEESWVERMETVLKIFFRK